MKGQVWGPVATVATAVLAAAAMFVPVHRVAASEISFNSVFPGETESSYKVLSPITHGNLTIFPVVAASTHDTSEFLTLDEGVRSGEVVVTEAGRVAGLQRGPGMPYLAGDGARVNQLVLVNNSKKPLLLLAGEIVTGGKQDRIIAKDRIVPPGGEPMDLNVFCVEPGRWTAQSVKFGGMTSQMAQPSVRAKAMDAKDQQQVWDAVGRTDKAWIAAAQPTAHMHESTEPYAGGPLNAPPMVGANSATAGRLSSTTSYARVMNDDAVQKTIDGVTAPIEHDYDSLIRELGERSAVGVVAAVNGRIIWADIFASPTLLQKYWPKLVRSYAAEALVTRVSTSTKADIADAQHFLADLSGRHEVVENEPGVSRHAEISGEGYKVFELTSLLPKTGFDVHTAKMAEIMAIPPMRRDF